MTLQHRIQIKKVQLAGLELQTDYLSLEADSISTLLTPC